MKRKPWNGDIAYAMTFYKFLTLPTGVWPLQNYNFFAAVRSAVTALCQVAMLIFQWKELSAGCNGSHANLDSLTIIACNIMAIIKISCYRFYSQNLIANYERAIKDYVETRSMRDLEIMRRHALLGKCLCVSLICFSYFSTSIFMLAPFFIVLDDVAVNATDVEKTFLSYPMPSDCTLGVLNVSIGLYCVISMLDIVLLISTCNGNLGNVSASKGIPKNIPYELLKKLRRSAFLFEGSDCLFFGIVLHVCGQVEILKIKFSQFKFQEGMKGEFNRLISRYSELLTLADYLVDTISIVLVAQLLVSCILICIIGYQCVLALQYSDAFVFAKSLTVLSTFLLQLLIYSYVGDYLTSQMEQVGYAAYSSTWYEFPITWRKNLAFLLMRSQRLVQIAAVYFFPVNMQTFMSIVKTSLSYLSVLRVMLQT